MHCSVIPRSVNPSQGGPRRAAASDPATGPAREATRSLGLASVVAAALVSACAVGPAWHDYYDPHYPDHRMAFEVCDAATAADGDFFHCMQRDIVRYPDRRMPVLEPQAPWKTAGDARSFPVRAAARPVRADRPAKRAVSDDVALSGRRHAAGEPADGPAQRPAAEPPRRSERPQEPSPEMHPISAAEGGGSATAPGEV